jgi:putative tRNA adenosine deaminase-associated protein
VSYFAAALSRDESGWSASEVELDDVDDLEALADLLRERLEDADGLALLLLEEDDEYVAVVRVDGGPGTLEEPRVFLSDARAAEASEIAGMLWEEGGGAAAAGDDDEGTRPVAEPVGDPALLVDRGTSGEDLLALCAEEGLLPADVITAVCERAGCLDVLEQVREG